MNSKKLKERIATLEMLNLELLEAIQILSLKVDHLRDDIEDQNASMKEGNSPKDSLIKVVAYTKAEYEQEEFINKLIAECKAKDLDPSTTKINPNQFIGWVAGTTSNSGTYYGTKTDIALL